MKRVRLIVSPGEIQLTLEALLTGRGGLDPDTFRRALAAGGVSVNRRRSTNPSAPLRLRDEVVATLTEHGRAATGAKPLDPARVLLIDAHVIAVDKPCGLPAQGTPSDASAGLDAAVRALFESRGEPAYVGLVHRLDLETSGITVFGRTPDATSSLAQSFREQRAKKTYRMLASGLPHREEWTLDAPLAPVSDRDGLFEVNPRGKPARTRFQVLERFEAAGACLLEARPQTGRTHQIRVHAAHSGHPLLGDRRYGGPVYTALPDGRRVDFRRVALHALRLELPHPAQGKLALEAVWPDDLEQLATALRALEKSLSGPKNTTRGTFEA